MARNGIFSRENDRVFETKIEEIILTKLPNITTLNKYVFRLIVENNNQSESEN